jgi:hypothetical protein
MKPFEYEKNKLFEIMNLNLSILINKDDIELIKVYENQYKLFIDELVSQEKYEFCNVLEQNKNLLLIKGIFTSKNTIYEN